MKACLPIYGFQKFRIETYKELLGMLMEWFVKKTKKDSGTAKMRYKNKKDKDFK